MRMRAGVLIVILLAALLAGCGGGSASSRAATRAAAGSEEEEEAGAIVEITTRAGDVQEGEMVAGEEGWVRSGLGVFWTRNGGRTWRSITPPVGHGFYVAGVYFADPRRGWALADAGNEGDVRAAMYRTTDGGRNWHRARLRKPNLFTSVTHVSFSMVGAHDLLALARESGDTASNYGSLLVSHDSGRHWRALPQPPKAGQISFETPRRGWLAVAWPGSGLYRTVDGGRSWAFVQPGKPPDAPTPKGEVLSNEVLWSAEYTTPLIGPNGHGILGMIESEGTIEDESKFPTPAGVLRTADDGRTWHRTARIELPQVGGVFEASEVFARRGHSRSFLLRNPIEEGDNVIGPDGHVGTLRPSRGLGTWWNGASFSDAKHGFAFPNVGTHPALLYTKDGGETWTKVSTPRARPGN